MLVFSAIGKKKEKKIGLYLSNQDIVSGQDTPYVVSEGL